MNSSFFSNELTMVFLIKLTILQIICLCLFDMKSAIGFRMLKYHQSYRTCQISSKLMSSKKSSSSSSTQSQTSATTNNPFTIKVAYQGEPGAYSEKAARELLGPRLTTVNYESFDDAFKAVALKEADYAVVPIENSLGGSIHTNFDLQLRYDLHVIGKL